MITVIRVTNYDSSGNHFTTKVSQHFDSKKEAKDFYKEEMVKPIRENTAAMRIINALPFDVKLIPKEEKPCQAK
jgi:hypothetical protein